MEITGHNLTQLTIPILKAHIASKKHHKVIALFVPIPPVVDHLHNNQQTIRLYTCTVHHLQIVTKVKQNILQIFSLAHLRKGSPILMTSIIQVFKYFESVLAHKVLFDSYFNVDIAILNPSSISTFGQ